MKEKQTVLVVDDEPKILELVKSYLEMNGYNALCAKNGREVYGMGYRLGDTQQSHAQRVEEIMPHGVAPVKAAEDRKGVSALTDAAGA